MKVPGRLQRQEVRDALAKEFPNTRFAATGKYEGRLLRVPECAVRLAVRECTVRKMVLLGKIDVVRIGRSVRIPESAVDAIIAGGYSPAKVL
jgi:excisionase family DNA binding protein